MFAIANASQQLIVSQRPNGRQFNTHPQLNPRISVSGHQDR